MNRRKFLGMLGLAPAVAVAAPLVVKSIPAVLDWSNCGLCNPAYSGTHLCAEHAAVIDPIIIKCAEELGWRAGNSMKELAACRNPQHLHDWASGDDCLV